MSPCLSVTLDSIVMDGTADGDGIVWSWRELPGWWEGGAPQGDNFGLLAADGSGHGEAYNRGRAVTVIGAAHAPLTVADPVALLLVARRRLLEAVDLNVAVELAVDEDTIGVLRLPVRQAPLQPRFPPQPSQRWLPFEMPLVSDDWRKTAQAVTQTVVGGGGVVASGGNARATPTLVVTGDSAANVGVTNATTGETISTDLDLAGGDTLVIDCATARATLNGADATDHLALGSEFFDLAVGNNTVNLVNAGAASLRVDHRVSWK